MNSKVKNLCKTFSLLIDGAGFEREKFCWD